MKIRAVTRSSELDVAMTHRAIRTSIRRTRSHSDVAKIMSTAAVPTQMRMQATGTWQRHPLYGWDLSQNSQPNGASWRWCRSLLRVTVWKRELARSRVRRATICSCNAASEPPSCKRSTFEMAQVRKGGSESGRGLGLYRAALRRGDPFESSVPISRHPRQSASGCCLRVEWCGAFAGGYGRLLSKPLVTPSKQKAENLPDTWTLFGCQLAARPRCHSEPWWFCRGRSEIRQPCGLVVAGASKVRGFPTSCSWHLAWALLGILAGKVEIQRVQLNLHSSPQSRTGLTATDRRRAFGSHRHGTSSSRRTAPAQFTTAVFFLCAWCWIPL